MLRTTNKQVKEKLNAHILSYFDQDHYGSDNPDATPLMNLKEQLHALSHLPTAYAAGRYMAEGGTFLVYYAEQRDFLGELLECNEFEWNDKYSNDQVFKTYCHLIGRQVAELVKPSKVMELWRIKQLRQTLADEDISYGELAEIDQAAEAAGIKVTDEMLAGDILDELAKLA